MFTRYSSPKRVVLTARKKIFFNRNRLLIILVTSALYCSILEGYSTETVIPVPWREISSAAENKKIWEFQIPLPQNNVDAAQLLVPFLPDQATGDIALFEMVEKSEKSERILCTQVVNPRQEIHLGFQLAQAISDAIKAGKKSLTLQLVNSADVEALSLAVFNEAEGPQLRLFTNVPTPPTDGPLMPDIQSSRVVAERVFPLADSSGNAMCQLLFDPKKIETVFSPLTGETYQEGQDYRISATGIEVLNEGNIRITPQDELFLPSKSEDLYSFQLNDGRWQVTEERRWWLERQVAVSYTAKTSGQDRFRFPPPEKGRLSRTVSLLKAKRPLEIVIFGDSIAVGASATGLSGNPPYQPAWDELLPREIKQAYGSDVIVRNLSRGGMTSAWGKNTAPILFGGLKSDLFIIAWGMNDRGDITPEDFRKNIESIMAEARKANPDCEIILVSSMGANPLWGNQENLPLYRKELAKLESRSVAIADMTAVTDNLQTRKSYYDFTGNGVNHPNDYLIRWYVKTLADLLRP